MCCAPQTASTMRTTAIPCSMFAAIIRGVTLANRELRTLRNQAHHYFDQLYLSGLMSKQDAYLWLAGLLQVPLSKAHIGFLGEYYCNEVIAESKKLLEHRRKQQPAGFRPCKGGEAS